MNKAYLFYGAPGSGKGTQTNLLKQYFLEKNEKSVIMGMGQKLRELADKDTLISKDVKDIVDKGKLVPSFVTTYILLKFLLEEEKNSNIFIFDGIMRMPDEIKFTHEMFSFLKIEPVIILLEVGNKDIKDRLQKRGREDDVNEEIMEIRIKAFNEGTINRVNDWEDLGSNVLRIDGTGTIEEVQKKIIESI